MTAYVTLAEADTYHASRLFRELWANTAAGEREKALLAASEHIDRLNFIGVKHAAYVQMQATPHDRDAILEASATQERQFPRGSDTEVPDDIKIACYEQAFQLVDGRDPDMEFEQLTTQSEGISSVRRTYGRSYAQEHLLHGIVSPLAWRYLKPYLRDGQNIELRRA